jgi:hypothetical protein
MGWQGAPQANDPPESAASTPATARIAMTNDDLTKLAAQWDRNADRYERRNASINRSVCHDSRRALNAGLAAGMRSAADQLRAAVGVNLLRR